MRTRTLSKNKLDFIQTFKPTAFYSLLGPHGEAIRADQLPGLVLHYKKKLGISILINGCTDYGQKIIKKKEDTLTQWISIYGEYPHAAFVLANRFPESTEFYQPEYRISKKAVIFSCNCRRSTANNKKTVKVCNIPSFNLISQYEYLLVRVYSYKYKNHIGNL